MKATADCRLTSYTMDLVDPNPGVPGMTADGCGRVRWPKPTWLNRLTSVHLWAALSDSITNSLSTGTVRPPVVEPVTVGEGDGSNDSHDPVDRSTISEEEWNWTPPDLTYGRAWYRRRLYNLRQACKYYPEHERDALVASGKATWNGIGSGWSPISPAAVVGIPTGALGRFASWM